jgi:hypothetical protein
MPTARLTKYDDLVAYLKTNNVPHKPDPANLAIELPVMSPADAGAVYIRWEKDLPYVQVVYPFLGNVPAARIPDIESAICRVNATIKLPGFGYQHADNFVFMRLCVQLYEDGITPIAFQRQIAAVLENAREFVAAFRDVINGAPAKDVIELALKHAREGAAR